MSESCIEERLARIAEQFGHEKAVHAEKVMLDCLDDLEDIYLAEERLKDLRAGRSSTRSLEQVRDELSVER